MSNVEYEIELSTKLDKIDSQLSGVEKKLDTKFKNAGKTSGAGFGKAFVGIASGILASVSFIGLAKSAITESNLISDALANVRKTTGLTGDEVKEFSKSLDKIDTRTSKAALLGLAEEAGRLGIAKKDLLAFTEAVDKINVALGDDFAGGGSEATLVLGKLSSIFKETKDLKPDESLSRIGSVLNELAASGASSAGNISDFTARMGALPATIKPGLKETLALGAVLEEVGINSEIASSGLSNVLLRGGDNLEEFAAQMKLSVGETKNLLTTNPDQFLLKFAKSLNGLSPEKLANVLKTTKIGSKESIKSLGALGGATERYGELLTLSNKSFEENISLNNEFNIKNNNQAANFEKFQKKLDGLVVTLGDKLAPALVKILDHVSPIIEQFADFIGANEDLTVFATGTAIALGVLGTIIATLGGPVTLIVAGIVAALAFLKYGFDNNFGGIQDKLKTFVEYFQKEILPNIQPIIDGLVELFKNIYPIVKPFLDIFFDTIGNQVGNFLKIFKGIVDVIRGVLDVVNGLFSGDGKRVQEGFERIFGGLGEIVKGAFNVVIDNINGALKSFNELGNNFEKLTGGAVNVADIPQIPKLAQGGSIIPPGYNNDTFPLFGPGGRLLAMAQSGERIDVVPRNEVNTDNRQINSGNSTQYIYQDQYKQPDFSSLAYNY